MNTAKRIYRALSALLTAVLGLVLVANIYTLVMRAVTDELQPDFFGFSAAVVISGSMSGSIEVNDMVIIRERDSYAVGDVITFQKGDNLITHRIIGEGEDGFITKGDANNAEDTEPVREDAVIGKIVLVIPRVGRAIELLRTPLGMTVLVFVGFLLIELPTLLERKKNEED